MAGLRARVSDWLARRRARAIAQAARAGRPDEGIGAEAPIQTAAEDRLRRADFAGRIASVLSELSLREGRVFAIRGGWGFGKSSLKNLITERLDAQGDGADWIDFNPWRWGDGDAITRALFGQIADRLGGEHSKEALARAYALRRYGAILTGAGAPLKSASGSAFIATLLANASVIAIASAIGFNLPTAAMVAAALAALSVVATLFGGVLIHLGRDRSAEPLDKVRRTLEAQLRDLERPLVVFVDDIDRLEPDQIRTLLRQVKANANLPNIVFVLIFQPSIVESALNPVADGNGRAFLEKVVQTNFDLPAVPSTVVHKVFGQELGKLAGSYGTEENGFSETRWGNAYIGSIQPYLRNMRDARRLLSSIAVHMPLHANGDVFEVNVVDFLILETFRVFEPDLHERLFRESSLVLQRGRFESDRRKDADKAAALRLLEVVPVERREVAENALRELFPQLEWAFGGTTYSDSFHPRWLAEKRACSPRFFPRYFELQTSEGELSERNFVDVLSAASDEDQLDAVISEIEASGLLHSLVARFDESVDRLPVASASALLPMMFTIGQRISENDGASAFNASWIAAWRAAYWYLKRVPKQRRGELAIEALRRTGALSLAATLIHLDDPADREKGREGTFDPALDEEEIKSMKGEWLRLIRKRASSPSTLMTDPDLRILLYRWRDYAGSFDEPRQWVSEIIQADEGFAAVIARLMGRGSTHGWGDRVSVPYNEFDQKTIEAFIGTDVAMRRSDAIDPSAFPEYEEALRTLSRDLQGWIGLADPAAGAPRQTASMD